MHFRKVECFTNFICFFLIKTQCDNSKSLEQQKYISSIYYAFSLNNETDIKYCGISQNREVEII